MTHVVIAEDDPGVRYLFQQIASELGWTSDTATSGEEALRLVRDLVPDLVIAESKLPRMGGIELLWALKKDLRLSHIPVVITSGTGNEEEARDAGCDLYLPKPWPFSMPEVFALLCSLVPEEPPSNSTLPQPG